MKVGIIVHSHSGYTLELAEALKSKIIEKGHEVKIERVVSMEESPSKAKTAGLKEAPSLDGYDRIIFAAPVWAFSLSFVMKKYLEQLENLDGKEVFGFVTQQLPTAILGGKQSIRCMKRLCNRKGGDLTKTGIIIRTSKKRNVKVAELVNFFSE